MVTFQAGSRRVAAHSLKAWDIFQGGFFSWGEEGQWLKDSLCHQESGHVYHWHSHWKWDHFYCNELITSFYYYYILQVSQIIQWSTLYFHFNFPLGNSPHPPICQQRCAAAECINCATESPYWRRDAAGNGSWEGVREWNFAWELSY